MIFPEFVSLYEIFDLKTLTTLSERIISLIINERNRWRESNASSYGERVQSFLRPFHLTEWSRSRMSTFLFDSTILWSDHGVQWTSVGETCLILSRLINILWEQINHWPINDRCKNDGHRKGPLLSFLSNSNTCIRQILQMQFLR